MPLFQKYCNGIVVQASSIATPTTPCWHISSQYARAFILWLGPHACHILSAWEFETPCCMQCHGCAVSKHLPCFPNLAYMSNKPTATHMDIGLRTNWMIASRAHLPPWRCHCSDTHLQGSYKNDSAWLQTFPSHFVKIGPMPSALPHCSHVPEHGLPWDQIVCGQTSCWRLSSCLPFDNLFMRKLTLFMHLLHCQYAFKIHKWPHLAAQLSIALVSTIYLHFTYFNIVAVTR